MSRGRYIKINLNVFRYGIKIIQVHHGQSDKQEANLVQYDIPESLYNYLSIRGHGISQPIFAQELMC